MTDASLNTWWRMNIWTHSKTPQTATEKLTRSKRGERRSERNHEIEMNHNLFKTERSVNLCARWSQADVDVKPRAPPTHTLGEVWIGLHEARMHWESVQSGIQVNSRSVCVCSGTAWSGSRVNANGYLIRGKMCKNTNSGDQQQSAKVMEVILLEVLTLFLPCETSSFRQKQQIIIELD